MNSKTLKYLSYGVVFLVFVPALIFKNDVLFYLFPAVAISYLLKIMALKKALLENRETDYLEALEKEIKVGKWAIIALMGLLVLKVFLRIF